MVFKISSQSEISHLRGWVEEFQGVSEVLKYVLAPILASQHYLIFPRHIPFQRSNISNVIVFFFNTSSLW
jgi:hypothetical protein